MAANRNRKGGLAPQAPKQQPVQQRGTEAPQSQQSGIPGQGSLLFNKHLAAGHMAWQGPLTTTDGEQLTMRADVTAENGYDVAVYRPSPVKGAGWERVDEFHIAPFAGSKLGQRIKTENLGELMASPGKTRTGRNQVRIQLLDPSGRPDQPVV